MLTSVHIDGTYLANRDRRFFALGAHWVSRTGLHWPTHWDPASIRADLEALKGQGANTVRIDLFWQWFEPAPGAYRAEAFEQLDWFIATAHELQLYLHPVLFIGGETGYYDVSWRHGRHPYADPDMLRLQTEHAAALVERYRGEPAILAWDLADEPPYWIVRGDTTTDAMAINWTRLLAGAVRRSAPGHLLCVGTDQEDMRHGSFRPDLIVDEVDFLSVHPYPIYQPDFFPDPMVSLRSTYAASFQTALSSGAGKPVMIHELGASAAQYDPDAIAAYDRTQIWSTIAAGSNGILMWDAIDAAPSAWASAPYLLSPHETQFGLSTADRMDRPAGAAVREIFGKLESLDLAGLEPEQPQAGLLVPFEWSKPEGHYGHLGITDAPGTYVAHHQSNVVVGQPRIDRSAANRWLVRSWLATYVLLRQAGIAAGFPREQKDWRSYKSLYLPAPLTSTTTDMVHVLTSFWQELPAWVEAGGHVYASVCGDAAIPEMTPLFGARLLDHIPVKDVVLTIVADCHGLIAGETFHYQANSGDRAHWAATLIVEGGTVIATDQAGRPALVAHDYGAGKTLLCAYPIETYLAETPNGFEAGDRSWCLLQALGVGSAMFRTDDPRVEAGTLVGPEGGYIILANHSGEAREVELTARADVTVSAITEPFGLAQDPPARPARYTVPAWDGLVLAWKS